MKGYESRLAQSQSLYYPIEASRVQVDPDDDAVMQMR